MKKTKLNINKFTVSKLTNPSTINGGNEGGDLSPDSLIRPKCIKTSNDYVMDIFDSPF